MTISAFAFEGRGVGIVAIVTEGSRQIIRIEDEGKTYRVLLDEASFEAKIESLNIPVHLKKEAIGYGQKFFKDFNSIQSSVENDLAKLWIRPLDSFAARDQSILEAPNCDFELRPTDSSLFSEIGFELPNEVLTTLYKNFPRLTTGEELVVVSLTSQQIAEGIADQEMIKYSDLSNAFQNEAARYSFDLIKRSVLDELGAEHWQLYLTTKKKAEAYGLTYAQQFSSVSLQGIVLSSPQIVFKLSVPDLMARYEAGEVGILHGFIRERFDVLDLELTRQATRSAEQAENIGEIRPQETRALSNPFGIPDLKSITFFQDRGVEVSGLISGGFKEVGKNEDIALVDSVYATPGLKTKIDNVTLSIVTKVDTESFQASSIAAQYDLTGPSDGVSMSLHWQLTNESKDKVAPIFEPRHLGGAVRLNIGIKF